MKKLKVLAIIKVVLMMFSLLAIFMYSMEDSKAASFYTIPYILLCILLATLLVFDSYIYLVVYFKNKSMELLKKIASIAGITISTSLLLFSMLVYDLFFWTFIISAGLLIYLALVSITVLIVRKIKGISV